MCGVSMDPAATGFLLSTKVNEHVRRCARRRAERTATGEDGPNQFGLVVRFLSVVQPVRLLAEEPILDVGSGSCRGSPLWSLR
jgi:hypothetical protein